MKTTTWDLVYLTKSFQHFSNHVVAKIKGFKFILEFGSILKGGGIAYNFRTLRRMRVIVFRHKLLVIKLFRLLQAKLIFITSTMSI